MHKINKETIEEFLIKEGWKEDNRFGVCKDIANTYISPDRRYILVKTRYSNLCEEGEFGYELEVQSSDFCSLAKCDVEFIEQINSIIEIYRNY